jgi:hypothetical protein
LLRAEAGSVAAAGDMTTARKMHPPSNSRSIDALSFNPTSELK